MPNLSNAASDIVSMTLDLPDGTLVDRARIGDAGAIREIIRRYNQRLFRAARSVIGDDGEAEDIVQVAYIKAFTHLDGFRGEAELSTWLTRIALNEAFNRTRRRRVTTDLERIDIERAQGSAQIIQFPMSQDPLDPEAEMSRQEMRQLLERAVDQLEPMFRLVFVLREIEGLSVEETAMQLSIRPETVKTRLFRARRMMRSYIETEVSGAFSTLYPFDGERCVNMADRVLARLNLENARG